MFLVFINRHAGWTRRQSLDALLSRLHHLLQAGGRVVVTQHPDEVSETLATLQAGDITALVPLGGDGTLSGVLTAACRRWGAEHVPAVLPLRAGTMNMVALDVRHRRETPLETLTRVVRTCRAGQPLAICERSLLQSDTGHTGFVAGLGAPARFLAHYDTRGGGFRQALDSLLQYSGSALLRGRLARELLAPLDATLTLDDLPPRTLPLSLLLAMTVDTLPLGFRVGQTARSGGMTLLLGEPDPVRLALSLPLIHRGYLPEATGITRLTGQRLTLDFAQTQPWQLDGDVLPAVRHLTLDARVRVRLLR